MSGHTTEETPTAERALSYSELLLPYSELLLPYSKVPYLEEHIHPMSQYQIHREGLVPHHVNEHSVIA